MATKHTPGPWLIDPSWDILGNTKDGNGMVCQITVDAVPRDEAAANAHLIAAAPDMYEALRTTSANIRSLGSAGALDELSKAEGKYDLIPRD